MKPFLLRSAFLVAFCACMTVARAEEGTFQLKQTISLPGVEGRIDHMALDASGERLFVCAFGNNTVEVLDLRKGERIHSITGLGAPQGIGYAPELNRLFVANDKGGICKIYDGKTFEAVGELDFKDDADNLRYDHATKKVYIGFGSGGIAIVNAPDGKQIGSIKLSAHPEAFELEKQGKRIFVNVPTALQIAVVDRDKGEVIATWGTGLALEISRSRWMKLIIGFLSAAAFPPGWSCSTQIRAMSLKRPISPAIATISSTMRNGSVYTRFAARERSTSSNRLMQTPIMPPPRSTRQRERARGSSCRNETLYL